MKEGKKKKKEKKNENSYHNSIISFNPKCRTVYIFLSEFSKYQQTSFFYGGKNMSFKCIIM